MSCDVKISDNYKIDCSVETNRVKSVQFKKSMSEKLQVAKIIYNYKQKTNQQIKDVVQLEIDNTIRDHPGYRFKDSKSHFNKTDGIEMVLNFEKL
jgi:hypothetical protein